ncbi:hypothetical protein LJC71_07610 [Desulfosarcina sp. OttesenSCG-928-A07]|nr:hypothetical protein [Desulfosarcina sp. OttesenSCG-928-A07]
MISIQIQTPARDELKKCNDIIVGIKDYQKKNWAIGLNGDTLQPDGFLAFFTERQLSFQYYVRSTKTKVNIGSPDAYDINIHTVEDYINNVKSFEKTAVNNTINSLEFYRSKNWAIGLNGDTLQPDNFLPFFAVRNLPFAYYVRNAKLSLGDASAYDANIKTLQDYLASL